MNKRSKQLVIFLVSGLALAGCATRATDAIPPAEQVTYSEMQDPYENVNRAIFSFNDALDSAVLSPIAYGYREVVPPKVRQSTRNFVRNLASPVVLLNDLLQGDFDRARITFSRFLVNSTIGMAGIYDASEGLGLPYHDEDFGQTLAVWNGTNGGGSYIVLPILGPSNTRDGFGLIVDALTDPLTWMGSPRAQSIQLGSWVAGSVDARSRYLETSDNLKNTTDDFYTTVRSLYKQNRDHEIRNGAPDLNIPAPGDFD